MTEDSSHKTEACLHSLSRRSYLSTVEHNTKCYAKYLSFSFGFNWSVQGLNVQTSQCIVTLVNMSLLKLAFCEEQTQI